MAQKLKAWPEDQLVKPTGRTPIYDWDSWLNGDIWKLTEGKDFKCKPDSFRSRVLGEVKRRGLTARTAVIAGSGPVEMVIQVVQPPVPVGRKK